MGERIALVTGANRGLGMETSRLLLGRGYRLILTSRDAAKGEAAAKALAAHGDVLYHPLDVADRGSVAALRAYVERAAGRLDALVNNAGVYLEGSQGILAVAEDAFLATLNTNTLGPLWLCRAFLPMMLAQGYGRVVNVSSGMGQMGDLNDYGAAYRVSKLALNGITRILADAVQGSNVLVNAVCPGWVRTDMGGPGASRSLEQGASGIVWAATLPDGGPSGGFFRDCQPIPW